MADETARVGYPERQTPEQEAAAAVEQAAHVAGCGICTTIAHGLFFTAWAGGVRGDRAGEMAGIVSRRFCAAITAAVQAGDKATPEQLAAAADHAIDAYLDVRGAHVPDPVLMRQTVAKTIAASLEAAGEVRFSGPTETHH